ncbi:MAG: hypothetical protein LBR08_13590 [Bacteroidales bacterium]|nr:hypothetical protein [Bacteroidales bacterium]
MNRIHKYLSGLLYIIAVTVVVTTVVPSCGGTKKSASMRKIERSTPMYLNSEGEYTPDIRSSKQKSADADRLKKEAAKKKEADKTYREALERHRSIQSEEMQQRMKSHLAASNKQYSRKKEFFLLRWIHSLQRKDAVAKIEKRRAKEVKKRMAASRKKAEENYRERSFTLFKGKERKSGKKVKPSTIQHGGGGTYREGKASSVNPSDIQHGGGGTYKEKK